MKKLISQLSILIIGLGIFLLTTIPASIGFNYFILNNPNKDWIKSIGSIPENHLYFVALLILFCSVFTAIVTMVGTLMFLKKSVNES